VRPFVIVLLLAVASAVRAEQPVFTDVTDEAGIRFTHSFGDHDLTNIVEGTGAGATFFDYDGDGFLDIYFVNGAWQKSVNDNRGRDLQGKLTNVLYRNRGDGTFEDVTAKAGVGHRGYGFGSSAADYDGDGDVDLYVLNYGPNVLYRNDGDGSFSDATAKAGLVSPRWSLSAPWLDYDNDGDLDLYVANYLDYDDGKFRSYYAAAGYPGPLSYRGQADALYRNNGDGTFTDVTEKVGVHKPNGRAMSAVAADINNDGYPDIVVANDAMENYYFQNDGEGAFVNRAPLAGLAYGEHGQGVSSMGPTIGDVDGNGRLDLFIPDMSYSSLMLNKGEYFVDHTTTSRLAVICGQYTGWGGILFDYDNDRDLDLFVSNGNAHHEYTEEDVLAVNDGAGRYTDVASTAGAFFKKKYVGRGSTWADYDNDGDLDLLVVNLNDRARLLRNDGGNRNHWLQVVVKRAGGKSEAIGARVTVSVGGVRQFRDVVGVMGYLSQGDARAHFGLGAAKKADWLEIRWPDRSVLRIKDVAADRRLTLTQGE